MINLGYQQIQCKDYLQQISSKNKMSEEVVLNIPVHSNSKPEIDWNFVLGLFFGIGYLIFGV